MSIVIVRRCTISAWSWLVAVAGAHEAGFVGEDDGLDAVAEVELLQDAGDVGLGRVRTYDELVGDLGVREAASDEPQHLGFAGGQPFQLLAGRGRRRGAGEPFDQPAGDRGREE
jgi:hypothetical protein